MSSVGLKGENILGRLPGGGVFVGSLFLSLLLGALRKVSTDGKQGGNKGKWEAGKVLELALGRAKALRMEKMVAGAAEGCGN